MSVIKKVIPYLLLAVFLFLSILFGIYDLKISENIVNYSSSFGVFFEQYGELVAPFFALISLIILIVNPIHNKIYNVIIIFVATILLFFIVHKTGIILIPIMLLLFFVFKKCDSSFILFCKKVALFTLLYFFLLLASTTIIKYFWGRVRFRDISDIAQFTHFYLPQGMTGHYSFPSGHTSSIMIVYVLSFFSNITKNIYIKALCYIIPILTIILMAISRVVIGAHYSSDVLFSIAMGSVLFYSINKIFIKKELW